MSWDSIADIAEAVKSGKTTAVENVEHALRHIKEGADYKAIIATIDKRAKVRAVEIDKKVASKEIESKNDARCLEH